MNNIRSRSLSDDFRASLRRSAFWAYASWLDIIVRYRRTSLGYVWAVLPPALFVCVLGVVYAGLMGLQKDRYLPFLGVGFLLWRFFIQAMVDSSAVIRNHKAFLQEGKINLVDLVLRVLMRAGVYFIFGVPVLLLVFGWSPVVSELNLLSLLITMPLFIYVMFFICLHVAILGARTPDVAEFINTALMFAFLLTPILWYPDHPHGGAMLQLLVKLNPVAHMLEFVRHPAMGDGIALQSTLIVAAIGLFLTLTGVRLYRSFGRYVAVWI